MMSLTNYRLTLFNISKILGKQYEYLDEFADFCSENNIIIETISTTAIAQSTLPLAKKAKVLKRKTPVDDIEEEYIKENKEHYEKIYGENSDVMMYVAYKQKHNS